MELVYLWVEDYKNIQKQGFNFSPRFDCSYDEKNYQLTICDKKKKECVNNNYIENFFGENINITAIVGENGSGKSSILSCIPASKKIFIVVFDKELKVYTRNIRVDTSLKSERLTSTFHKNILYYSMDNTYLRDTNRSINHIVLENTNKLITENYLKLNELNFNLFDFKPYYIYYELNDLKLVNENDEITDDDIYRIKSSLGWDYSSDSGVIFNTIKALEGIDDEYLIYLLSQFGGLNELFENIDLTEKLHPKNNNLILTSNEIQEKLEECEINFFSKHEFDLFINNQTQKIRIEELESVFGKNYNEMIFDFMNDDIGIDYYSENGASFNSLSHGEKTIYSFILNVVNFDKNDFLLFLDEPDNTLHPDWQKSFLNELIQVIKRLDKKVHIVITTHSPFLLSDIPKQNVIFLEKDKETGECTNATDVVNINPFGANIHTLLSHGFFMKEGLMGEFAKRKINDLVDYLNGRKSKIKNNTEAENIINIIGEPILKSTLKSMFDEKLYSNESKLSKLERKKREIEKAIMQEEQKG